jgi:hypothetical protein
MRDSGNVKHVRGINKREKLLSHRLHLVVHNQSPETDSVTS